MSDEGECKECGATITRSTTFCRFCNTVLPEFVEISGDTPSSEKDKASEETKSPSDSGFSYTPLNTSKEEETKKPEPSPSSESKPEPDSVQEPPAEDPEPETAVEPEPETEVEPETEPEPQEPQPQPQRPQQQRQHGRLTRWLASAPSWALVVFAIGTSFSTYFCMYAFRKPFSAAQFEGLSLFGTQIELKTAFVISQVIGYALSKYLGIKFCSEMTRGRRLSMLIGLVVVAEIALLLFAVLPPQLKIFALFANGLPLGMVWGLVVWYLEGRRTSELLLAGLSCSFILASGVVKDIGRWLMGEHGVSEFWMPFATGLIFLLPFVLSALLLDQLPDPDDDDEAERTHRKPMDGAHRISFLKRFLVPLSMLFFAYVFLTAYRDFRDNYGVEMFTELGYGGTPGIFSISEICVAFGVLVPLALLFLIRDNFSGLLAAFALMMTGALSLGVSTLLLDRGAISGLSWMILVGIGSYLAYVPYGSILFDRMIAQTHVIGTAVFAIYVADALGYTGSVAVLLFKDLVAGEATRLDFFRSFTYLLCIGSSVLILISAVLILRGGRTRIRPV